jgi:hypothetical protein
MGCDKHHKKHVKCDITGIYTGTINFTGQPAEAFTMNFGKGGYLTMSSRLEFPLLNPEVPELGGDLEGVGVGQYKAKKDGSYDYAVFEYRQGVIPTLLGWNIPSDPNYVLVFAGNFKIKCGKLEGTMKIGAGDVNFALPDGVLTNSIPVDSITLEKQPIKGLFDAIPN